jgi:transcription antitermination factor NusG
MATAKTATVPARVVPLFVGYIFVHVLDVPWQRIRRIVGVTSVLTVGESPSRCRDAEVAALKMRVDERGVIRLPPPPLPGKRRIAAGTKIMIVGGPLAGLHGLHTGMMAHEREVILLDRLLGRATRVEVDPALVAVR